MKWRVLLMGLVLTGMFLSAGCKSLFSHNESATVSRWECYKDVEAAFGTIVPNQTTVADLRTMGFHPSVAPNVKILTYVDIIKAFMPTPAIQLQDLPDGVRACVEAKENSRAYLVEMHDLRDKRHGNLFLDIFGFKRFTHTSGWEFKGLILIKGDLVVYKLSSGEPQVSRDDNRVKPLGPLQELDFIAGSAVNLAK
jgi:hypothetical protein